MAQTDIPNISALSGTPDVSGYQVGARIDRDEVERIVVKNNRGHCRICDNQLGTVKKRDLLCGNSLLVKRTPIRCGDCGHRNIWLPLIQDRT